VPAHEIRTPVDVITVGRALLELAAGKQEGIFHIAGNDRLNRREIAQRIATTFCFNSELIVAQESAASPGRAVRPRDVSLDNARARAHLKTPMRTFDEGLSLVKEATGALSL
jgi:dTDP-4-dehydrorhamnose reductase